MYAVVACSRCQTPWAVELRHKQVSCPRCRTRVELKQRRRFWEGENAREARAAASEVALQLAGGQAPRPTRVARHDSTLDAAASKGRGIRNLSKRSESVACWMVELGGPVQHEDLVLALQRAGVGAERAEKEITRMLAGDLLFEPMAGKYDWLD